ncbi:MAG: hypothetical protein AAFO76_08545, partial [Cyanobacteria bacterium J06607_15]
HLWVKGKGKPTVVLDHSLGGIEGYFLIEAIAKLTRVCIYDRPGYGWLAAITCVFMLNSFQKKLEV